MSVEPGKWGVIYNPKAGTRKVQKRWKEIKEYMDSKGVNYDYVQSEGFGSVERLAKILANNGYRTIVIVGGDCAPSHELHCFKTVGQRKMVAYITAQDNGHG